MQTSVFPYAYIHYNIFQVGFTTSQMFDLNPVLDTENYRLYIEYQGYLDIEILTRDYQKINT